MNLVTDLRQSIRSLARSRAFTLTASLTLAVGLGTSVAALNLAESLLRRPLSGIPDQEQLIMIWSGYHGNAFPKWLSTDELGVLAERFRAAGQIAGYQRNQVSVGLPRSRAQLLNMEAVSHSYFTVLGVTPVLGSVTRQGGGPGEQAIVISDRLGATLFDRRADAVGATINVDGRPMTVTGVAPPGFVGIERLNTTDLWIPDRGPGLPGPSYFQFVARLSPTITLSHASAVLKSALDPKAVQVYGGLGVSMLQRSQVERFLALSVAGSTLVLIIACANVANLLLFRGLTRRPETAMHRALGASAASLVRRHIAEAALLAVPAMLVGVPFAIGLTQLLGKVRLIRWSEPFGPLPIAWPQLALAVLAALLVAGAAGTVPAIIASRTSPLLAVQGMGRVRGAKRLRQLFTATQLALSLSLVVATLLVFGTMLRLRAIDLGFEPRGVLTLNVDPSDAGYSPDDARRYYRNLLDQLQQDPETEASALAWAAPISGWYSMYPLRPAGRPAGDTDLRVRSNQVSSDYFGLLRMRLLEGRTFTTAELGDTAALSSIILSRSVARSLFGNGPAVGQTVALMNRDRQVVGVVEDSHWDRVEPTGFSIADSRLIVFTPFDGVVSFNGRYRVAGTVFVRARGSEAAAANALRRVTADLDPLLPPYQVSTLQSVVDLSLLDRLVLVRMMGILGALATVLAAVGVYGLVAYSVATSRRDLGIRIALGARPRAVASFLLGEVFLVGCCGIAGGWSARRC